MKIKTPSWKRNNINEIYKEVGTYVGVKWAESTAEILLDWAKENGVPNLINKNEIHSTLIYSRVGFNHKPSTEDFSFSTIGPNNSTENRFHVFENKERGHKALVIKIYSQQMIDRHNEIMKNNPKATYDFDEYIPHITLSYHIEDFDVNKLDYEDFSQRLEDASGGKEYTENLDLNKFNK